jgi:hypothetical protein
VDRRNRSRIPQKQQGALTNEINPASDKCSAVMFGDIDLRPEIGLVLTAMAWFRKLTIQLGILIFGARALS